MLWQLSGRDTGIGILVSQVHEVEKLSRVGSLGFQDFKEGLRGDFAGAEAGGEVFLGTTWSRQWFLKCD